MKWLWLLLLSACQTSHASRAPVEVADETQDAFAQPLPGLSARERSQFFVGNSYFNQNWVSSPSTLATRAGLGPRFNARSCSGCHFRDGRGEPPAEGEPPRSSIVRLRGADAYGEQLQDQAVGAQPEARVRVRYRELPGRYADDTPYSLREPVLVLDELALGPLPATAELSARVAPALMGVGLLEAVADRQAGFGWKGEQPSVLAQTAAAFFHDMGITSRVIPDERAPEATDQVLDAVVHYVRSLAVPARRPGPARGEALFREHCASCHAETLRTRADAVPAELADRTIHPYTDLMLHDMGPGLASHGTRWRTPPLWGLGLVPRVNGHHTLLHDGRARGVHEAVLWHGGEGQRAKLAFEGMTRSDRDALVAFVESL